MNDRSAQTPITLSIAAVERDTGLSKDTLRVWERRYGFPAPGRDAFGERAYPLEQVERLRLLRRLMDAGHRPGKIIGLSADQLQLLVGESSGPPQQMAEVVSAHDDLLRFIDLIRSHRVEDLRGNLSQAALRIGLERFVMSVCAPLNVLVGEAWARGQIEIFEEHLYTESMQVVLRNAISTIPVSGASPRVLLTTFPNEAHGLGLLMVEALMALDGCHCTSLGTQTPILDIVRAASSGEFDVVAISFSASQNPNHVLDGLTELREHLPPTVDLWAGGQCPVLQRRPPAGIPVLVSLADIAPALRRWRATHARRPAR
ncbi:MAG: MerR family transcriptional regulator [Betaproteobacteria bacterium]|nr:MerR family transcriptional regulator [Betaproteobacteria bacterium]